MLSVVLLITLSSSKANNNTNIPFSNNETVYVSAPSGLTLREMPHKNGRIIDIIPFGESVNIIVEESENLESQRIDWIDGQWIKVEFEGDEGFVFDGFLSQLPLPMMDFELVDSDLNFTYAFQSWMDYRFTEVQAPDTIQREDEFIRVIHHFEDDQTLIEKDEATFYMIDATLKNVRLTDVYHILMGMLPSKVNRKYVQEQTIFIENQSGELNLIKLLLPNPVVLKKRPDGSINIKLYSNYTGCSL